MSLRLLLLGILVAITRKVRDINYMKSVCRTDFLENIMFKKYK